MLHTRWKISTWLKFCTVVLYISPGYVQCQTFTNDILRQQCPTSEVDPSILLQGTNVRVVLNSGEQSECNHNTHDGVNYQNHCDTVWAEMTQAENDASAQRTVSGLRVWDGWDIKLLDALAKLGQFNYTIINMGRASYVGTTTPYQLPEGCFESHVPSTNFSDHESYGYACVGDYCSYSGRQCRCGNENEAANICSCATYYPTHTLNAVTGRCESIPPVLPTTSKYPGSYAGLDFDFTHSGYTPQAMQALGILPINYQCGIDGSNPNHANTKCLYNSTNYDSFVPAHVIGQSNWRVNFERSEWAMWSLPALSEDVQFVTVKKKVKEATNVDQITLFLKPFSVEAWIAILLMGIVMMVVLLLATNRQEASAWEISRGELCHYAMCSLFRAARLDFTKYGVSALAFGWLFTGILILEFYLANLTALLSAPITYHDYYESVDQLVTERGKFCIRAGSANSELFSADPRFEGLELVMKSSIASQLQAVADGECAATEVAREDFFLWSSSLAEEPHIGIIGEAIAARSKGFMTRVDFSCIILALNAVLHEFSVSENEQNLNGLWVEQFGNPQVSSKEGYSVAPLELRHFYGGFGLLAFGTIFGALSTYVGTKFKDSACIKPIVLSEEGRQVKLEMATSAPTSISLPVRPLSSVDTQVNRAFGM